METKKISGEEEEKIKEIRSVLGKDLPETDILRALWLAGNNTSEAINVLLDAQKSMTPSVIVKKTVTSTGARVSTEIKQEISEVSAEDDLNKPKVQVKEEESSMSFDKKVVLVKEEPMEFELNQSQPLVLVKKEEGSSNLDFDKKKVLVKEEVEDLEINRCQALVPINEPKYMLSDDYSIVSIDSTKTNTHSSPYNRPSKPYDRPSKPINVKPKKEEQIDDGDFPEEPEWLLVGRSTVVGLSTCKRKKLDFNEIVYFEFPSNPKTKIVRFSTKRSGEIGRLPIEWTKCIIPLVNSSRVKFYGRCVTASTELRLMQEIHLYISFYIHYSVFTEGDNSSWSLTPPSYLESIVHPLPTLLKLLKMKPFKQAEFTPEELNSHKRKLNLHGDSDVLLPLVSVAKRTKGSQQFSEPNKDEQTISESTLNKLVGAAEVYNLEEMDPPSTLTCVLHPYQKQALHWMSKTEEGMDVERAAQNLHPCWEVYHITDKRTSEVYINIFSGEATAEFPSSTQMTRGGILADAMGLGKTVMTIALILARPGRGIPDNQEIIKYDPEQVKRKYRNSQATYSSRVKGGTLIVCPMALLGQWKDELETHSEPGTLQVYVQYGVDRTTTPYALAEHGVVLTTYGVLDAAYKSGLEESIFHKVD